MENNIQEQQVTQQNSCSEPQSVQSVSRGNKKVLVILLVVVVLLLLGGGGYLVLNKSIQPLPKKLTTVPTADTTPTVISTKTVDKTATLETFKNKDFSFMYSPSFMQIDKQTANLTTWKANYADQDTAFLYSQSLAFDKPIIEKGMWLDENKDILLGGKNAHSYIIGATGDYYMHRVDFQVGDRYYQFIMDIAGGGLETEFEKIISTFKFTEQTQSSDTSSWKSYTNEFVTFSYPSFYTLKSYGPSNNSVVDDNLSDENRDEDMVIGVNVFSNQPFSMVSDPRQNPPNTTTTNIIIDNHQTVRYDNLDSEPGHPSFTELFIKNNNNTTSYIYFWNINKATSKELIKHIITSIRVR